MATAKTTEMTNLIYANGETEKPNCLYAFSHCKSKNIQIYIHFQKQIGHYLF